MDRAAMGLASNDLRREGVTLPGVSIEHVSAAVHRFVEWLDRYGETSYDKESFFAGAVGRYAKALYYRRRLAGTVAVAPMVFCEAFAPRGRRLFWKRQRFPIADAHYAMGFAFLSERVGEQAHYRRAAHFLGVLETTRCPGYERHAWGYPFDWVTRTGTVRAGTPLITTVGYPYQAFRHMYRIDKDERWRFIMRSIAQHALLDYRDRETVPGAATCAYTPQPDDPAGIVNASAYRAALLVKAAHDFSEPEYHRIAERNLNFVLGAQNPDGSWPYAIDGHRDFVDHFHTCFVLKALAEIEAITGERMCTEAIERGVTYYVRHLFDEGGLPLPFSRAPRLTVYRRELYDYAECVNLATLLAGRFPELDRVLVNVLSNLLERWQTPDGSFRSRRLLAGWDNVPMHRWAQAQMFRSLCFLLWRSGKV
jgi:hypothetical protein